MSGHSREALEQALERLIAIERYREGLRHGIPACGAAIALIESALATSEAGDVAVLREENARLRKALAPQTTAFPDAWGLSAQQAVVLAAIISASPEVATTERIFSALFSGRIPPSSAKRIPPVLVSALRQRLKQAGVDATIRRVPCEGYVMDLADRDRLTTLMENAR